MDRVAEGVFFTTPAALPRGRHLLTREAVVASQRERSMIAVTELLAAEGYRGVGVREISARAAISRAAFYDAFPDKDACVFAAYDRFIAVLLERLAERAAVGPATMAWDEYVAGVLLAYLDTLRHDLVVARAFQVEMDALGRVGRERRRRATIAMAQMLQRRRLQWSVADAVLPLGSYLGVVYAVRQLASDALDGQDAPDLVGLVPEMMRWVSRMLAA